MVDLSILTVQKNLRQIEQETRFLQAENRLLINYLQWFEARILPVIETRAVTESPSKLSVLKKRDIAETVQKVLLGYSQKLRHRLDDFLGEALNKLDTDDETSIHLAFELTNLRKFSEKNQDKKQLMVAEELVEYFRERIRHWEALKERKNQKTVRLRFRLDSIEKSIGKVRQIVDTISEVDYQLMQIDIEKQMKDLKKKNQLIIFYKRQQTEVNGKLNDEKPELFNVLRSLASIRQTIRRHLVQSIHLEKIRETMNNEIVEYEKSNEPMRRLIASYRVPSINDYVNLKSKQINLHRQVETWNRKLKLVEHELRLRQIENQRNPEQIVHPWKSLKNPSHLLFHQRCKPSTQDKRKINTTLEKSIS